LGVAEPLSTPRATGLSNHPQTGLVEPPPMAKTHFPIFFFPFFLSGPWGWPKNYFPIFSLFSFWPLGNQPHGPKPIFLYFFFSIKVIGVAEPPHTRPAKEPPFFLKKIYIFIVFNIFFLSFINFYFLINF
jgi:hypothetical protein